LSGVVAIAAVVSRSLALKSDGTVVAWGDNWEGQSTVPSGLSGVVAIAAGGAHSLALKSDGTVVAWGDSGSGQSTVPSGLNGVVAIAAGDNHSLALKSDGTVVAWGAYRPSTVPDGLSGVVAISAGEAHSLALKSDGTVMAWGDNGDGQSTVPDGLTCVVAIAAGYAQSLALIVATNQYTAPAIVFEPFSQVVPIGCSPTFSVLAVGESLKYQWRKNGTNITGATNSVYAIFNAQSNDAGNYSVLVTNAYGTASSSNAVLTVVAAPPLITLQPQNQIAHAGRSANFGVTVFGAMPLSYQWRKGGINISGATSSVYRISSVQGNDAGSYSVLSTNAYGAAGSSSVILTLMPTSPLEPHAPGNVVGWGSGAGPVPGGLNGVVAIAAGEGHSVALKADGTVVAWGVNDQGQATVPSGLTGVVAIAAGSAHSLALKSDGTVVGWGANDNRQSTVPDGLSGVVAIAAGGYSSLALKSDSTVVGWGDADPVPAGLAGVVAIAAGGANSLALKSDGTVVAWGTLGQSWVPDGLTGVVAIATGPSHSLALKSDGTVVAWGQIWNFTNVVPATVPTGLTGVVAIAAGGWHSLALKSDGTVVAWGDNAYGESTVPGGLTGVVEIAAAFSDNLALVARTNQTTTPAVVVQTGGNSLSLSWPLSAQGFALQSTTNLADPNAWITVTNLPIIVGSQSQVIDTVADPAKFYRLKK
jgi:alpha-tubulin suppressor-like RCC1 family protein